MIAALRRRQIKPRRMITGDKSINRWIKQRRSSLDLTQEDLADCIGCSGVTIQKIESGERRPSRQIANRLAMCLRIPPDEQEAFIQSIREAPSLISPPDQASQPVPGHTPHMQATLTNLPAPLTQLIGREQTAEDARNYLLREDVRLLTLTGAPGIGKTRLGLQVAADLLAEFTDGVFLVELVSIGDPDLVAPTIAGTLALKETTNGSSLEGLKQFIAGKKILLLLDNFEQVLDAAPVVVGLLSSCARLKVLVTSREALHIVGEQQFPVPPLRVPDLSQMPAAQEPLSFPAVELFMQRASATDPGFRLTQKNAGTVAVICARLEGLPLAIELAAARIKLLSPTEMLAHLDSQLGLLTGTARYRDPLESTRYLPLRHQTMREAVAWSYHLLTPGEQKLLSRLGVFVGGWTPAAAEATCAPHAAPDVDVAAGVESLVEKNLVRHSDGDQGSPRRFSMLQTIREFALDELFASGEAAEVRGWHARYFMTLAEQAEQEMAGADQGVWLARLETEHDNLRAALLYAQQAGDAEMGLRTGTALFLFWHIRGHINEGRKWISEALERGTEVAHALRAKALNSLGNFAGAQSDYTGARRYHTQSLELAQATGDKLGMARAFSNLGNTARLLGEYERAMSRFEQALALLRELGRKEGIALCLRNMGIVASGQGDATEAQRLSREALSIQRELGDKQGIATTLNGLGTMAVERGDYKEARAYSEECLVLFRELGDRGGEARALYDLGEVVSEERDYRTARALQSESLRIRYEQGTKRGVAESLRRLAVVEKEQAAPGRLVRLIAASEALTLALGAPVSEHDRRRYEPWLEHARTLLTPEEFNSAEKEGRTLTMAEAVALALEE